MNQKSTSAFLEQQLALLIQHFGIDRVRAALPKALTASNIASVRAASRPSRKSGTANSPSTLSLLEQVRKEDEEKYSILIGFFTRLKNRSVLPDSQDIRQFAPLVGLKEVPGKSRKDMFPLIMRTLMQLPIAQLEHAVKRADTISEQRRQQGFAILTDKLLR